MIVTLSAAKSDLSRLIEKIERGQEAEIIITRNRVPVVRLTQLKESSTMLRIGVAKGKFELPESTDTDNPKVARLFLKGRG